MVNLETQLGQFGNKLGQFGNKHLVKMEHNLVKMEKVHFSRIFIRVLKK